jgi:hypothetical protein
LCTKLFRTANKENQFNHGCVLAENELRAASYAAPTNAVSTGLAAIPTEKGYTMLTLPSEFIAEITYTILRGTAEMSQLLITQKTPRPIQGME